MKVFYVFLLVLVFGVVSSHGRTIELQYSATTPFKTSTTSPYDEFFLVQQWPKSFCSVTPCSPIPPAYFTVHGLWAQLKSGQPVTCPNIMTFDISKINPNTKLDMAKYWPDLKGINNKFWGHEYEKHASCISLFQNDQDKYFSSTLKLAKRFNVTTMLLKAGILPGISHSISDIKNAIRGYTKVISMLQCNKAKDGTFQLYQIYLCTDKNASKLQHCRRPDKNCPTQNNGNSRISFPWP